MVGMFRAIVKQRTINLRQCFIKQLELNLSILANKYIYSLSHFESNILAAGWELAWGHLCNLLTYHNCILTRIPLIRFLIF